MKINAETRLTSIPWIRIGAESAAIVASILIAFAIDSWWADRNEGKARKELVAAMLLDFQETISAADATRAELVEQIERVKSFQRLIDERGEPPLADLRAFLAPAFITESFRRSVSSYDSALSSGAIGLVDSADFSAAMSRFTEALERYKLHEQLWLQFLYIGPNAELQQKLGDVRVLLKDPETLQSRFALKGVALRQAYSDKLVYANSRTALISKQINVQRLTEMRDSLREAIEALNALD
jgi:hypothetical protein